MHAHKLAKQGGRNLYNQLNKPLIRWKDTDLEGQEILEHGPLCVVYKAKLMYDDEAMSCLSIEGNMNAEVEMGESEVAAFGRVLSAYDMVTRNGSDGGSQPAEVISRIMEVLKRAGTGRMPSNDWQSLIKFRMFLNTGAMVAKGILDHVNRVSQGRARVRPHDFSECARLDPRYMMAGVSVLLSQYLSVKVDFRNTENDPGKERKEQFAKRLVPEIIKELVQEVKLVAIFDVFIHEMLDQYPLTVAGENAGPEIAQNVMAARLAMMGEAGSKMLWLAGRVAMDVKKIEATRRQVGPHDKEQIVKKHFDPKLLFGKMEQLFRASLVKKQVVQSLKDLPAMKYEANARGLEVQKEDVEEEAATDLTTGGQRIISRLGLRASSVINGDGKVRPIQVISLNTSINASSTSNGTRTVLVLVQQCASCASYVTRATRRPSCQLCQLCQSCQSCHSPECSRQSVSTSTSTSASTNTCMVLVSWY